MGWGAENGAGGGGTFKAKRALVQYRPMNDNHGLEQIKWEVSAQALNDYEQALEHCVVAWKDSYASPDSFNKTYAAYLAEGMPGKSVAHEFFATHEMILKESQ